MFKTKKQTNKNTINKKTKIVKKNDKQTSVRSVPEVVKKKTKKIRSEKTKTPIVTIAETPIIETTNTKKTKRTRKPKAKMYFTSETEDSIIEYNSSDDQSQRNDIYNIKIKYAFEKLVENVFNTFKFCYFETSPLEVQKETVAHLVANIHKFESGKGKAFSYFSIIAKNYLIFQNNTNYKRFNQHVEIGEDNGEYTYKLQHEDVHYKEEENREFLQLMVIYWEKNVNKIFY